MIPPLALALLAAPHLPRAEDIVWRTDLDAAIAEAERDGRPLLVVFR